MSVSGKASIKGFTLGPFATNSYVVAAGDRCWIIDPSFGPGPLVRHVQSSGLTPTGILLTHAHVDHIAGVADVRRAFSNAPIRIHELEAEWLGDPLLNLSGLSGMSITAPGPDGKLVPGERLWLGEGSDAIEFEVRFTPGHSPGSVSLVAERWPGGPIVIAGDALFAGSIGRTDFPGSDHETLLRSIRTQLYTLPEETTVYPGHGPATTIGREKRTNPFVRG